MVNIVSQSAETPEATLQREDEATPYGCGRAHSQAGKGESGCPGADRESVRSAV